MSNFGPFYGATCICSGSMAYYGGIYADYTEPESLRDKIKRMFSIREIMELSNEMIDEREEKEEE